MKRSSFNSGLSLVISILLVTINSCKKTEDPIKFPEGTFPDSTFLLTDLCSNWDDREMTNIYGVMDDMNSDSHQLLGNIISVFSTNRTYSGEQYDLGQGILTFDWDQTTGVFGLGTDITQDAFITKLTQAANTTGDDLGPYRFFSSADGYEYLLLSSENASGNLDFYYLKNIPVTGSTLPAVLGPYPAQLINTDSSDVYISFDTNQDSAYFSSKIEGNFEIYLKKRPADTDISTWFNASYSASTKVDSINSTSDDKCPMVYGKVMVFASNRPGGIGGFDLYYSVFRNGKWSSAVNFGPDINTSSNELRPVIGTHSNFSNHFLIFSSNRPGGKGGYDLYFRGVTIK
jgi:hypothetical protein